MVALRRHGRDLQWPLVAAPLTVRSAESARKWNTSNSDLKDLIGSDLIRSLIIVIVANELYKTQMRMYRHKEFEFRPI